MQDSGPARSSALHVARALRASGFQAFFAGGCVRDALLGRTPQDYDVATDADPDAVQRLFRRTVAVGARFGVVVVLDGGEPVEVATFREDVGHADGRRPDAVRFTDAKGDVLRRDFTVNGLLEDPETGEVVDYVGGRADLAARTLRAIGDPARRFEEDRLRMLRAVRFSAELGFAIEPATARAVREAAPAITSVSWERIAEEIGRILTSPHPRKGLETLDDLGLMDPILPEMTKLKGVEQPVQYHPEGDVWIHTLMLFDHLPAAPSRELAWGALLHDIAKPRTFKRAPDRIRFDGHDVLGARMAEAVCRRFRLSNASTDRIVWLVRTHLYFKDLPQMRPAKVRRFLTEPGFPEALDMHYADCMASHGNLELHAFCKARLAEYAREPARPAPLLTGNDLIALGLAPSPAFKEILESALDEQLEGKIRTREEALAWAKGRMAGDR